jgi:hypothetical protein
LLYGISPECTIADAKEKHVYRIPHLFLAATIVVFLYWPSKSTVITVTMAVLLPTC